MRGRRYCAYDGAGDRIQTKTITNGGADTNIVKFSYDGSDLLYEHDESGAVVIKYLYGPGIDNILETEDQSGTYYHYGDALGSVSKTTDASGTEVVSKVHDSFGRLMFTSGSSSGDRIGFTGREYETDLGIYYYRARFYDPNIGRFISRDPIGFAAGDLNMYRYVFNSPWLFIDPFGLRLRILGDLEEGQYGPPNPNVLAVEECLEMLEKQPEGKKLVDYLRGNKFDNVIDPTWRERTRAHFHDCIASMDPEKGSAGTVYFNLSEPHFIPLFLRLSHELIHVRHYNEGTRNPRKNRKTGWKFEEERTVDENNIIHLEHGCDPVFLQSRK